MTVANMKKKTFACNNISYQSNVRVIYTPYIPLLYSKTGIYRGKQLFLLLILASNVYPQSMF